MSEMVEKVYRLLSDAAIPNINGDNRSVRYYASVGIDAFGHDPLDQVDHTAERRWFVDRLLWKAAEDVVAALSPHDPTEKK
jgi:hypothetical protein